MNQTFYLKNQYIYVLIAFYFCTPTLFAQVSNELFDPSYLHEIRIYFEKEDFWEILTDNYDDNIGDGGDAVPYISATTVIDGVPTDSVGIRQKGKSSYSRSNYYKKPLKIDFNEFVSGQTFGGIKKFNLHNGGCDPAMMRDLLGFDMMRQAGVKAPRYAHCRLYLNDEFWGVYGIIEQIDGAFVEEHFSDGSGNLFKNGGWSELHWKGDTIQNYDEYELKTNREENDWSGFINFVDVLNNTPEPIFAEAIQEVFNVDLYLHVLAIDVLTNNWDSYIDNRRNWYLYEDPSSGKFQWIPWDYNLAMGGDFSRSANPFRPIDTTCWMKTDFTWIRDGLTFSFIDETEGEITPDEWLWEFGDGSTTTISQPSHEYELTGDDVRVCLTTKHTGDDGHVCEHTRCTRINLSYNPADCNTISNGTSPYPANDPIFQQVTADDDFCCDGAWDAVCQIAYQDILLDQQIDTIQVEDFAIDYDLDFPLILDNPDKPLIQRIMNVPEFRQRYLDIVCSVMETNFTRERLFPMIDFHADLIRNSIHEEPHYNFYIDHFEYDIGNGTGGGDDASIPALKKFFNERIPQVKEDLAQLEMDCSAVVNAVNWQDIVINEIVASNDENSGQVDADGEAEDWIELYNNTAEPITLDGIFLSDNLDLPYKWSFPLGTVIDAHGYLIVWADKDEQQAGLHTNFKLSKDGESIKLTHESGTIINSLSYGEQVTNIALARMPNGTGDFVSQAPTFNQNNETVSSLSNSEHLYEMDVYPNPTKDWVHINKKGQLTTPPLKIELKDALGRTLLKRQNIQQFPIRLNLETYESGVYFLDFSFEDGNFIKKIILSE